MSTRIYFEEYGSPQVLNVGTEELPEPAEGQVRVEFRAVSVNPMDWKIVAGYVKQWVPLDLPAVPGSEAAGVVTEVGPAFEGFAVGDEVIWNGLVGGYRTEAAGSRGRADAPAGGHRLRTGGLHSGGRRGGLFGPQAARSGRRRHPPHPWGSRRRGFGGGADRPGLRGCGHRHGVRAKPRVPGRAGSAARDVRCRAGRARQGPGQSDGCVRHGGHRRIHRGHGWNCSRTGAGQ